MPYIIIGVTYCMYENYIVFLPFLIDNLSETRVFPETRNQDIKGDQVCMCTGTTHLPLLFVTVFATLYSIIRSQ